MDEESESINTHAAAGIALARTKNGSWPNDDVRKLMFPAIFLNQFFLLELSEAVGIKAFLRRVFQGAIFVQKTSPSEFQGRINSEGTDIHETPRLALFDEGVEQIARRKR